jgi:hypothetical protein
MSTKKAQNCRFRIKKVSGGLHKNEVIPLEGFTKALAYPAVLCYTIYNGARSGSAQFIHKGRNHHAGGL